MTTSSGLDENIEFVGRQLSFLSDKEDFSIDNALEKIESNGNMEMATAVSHMRGLLQSDNTSLDHSYSALYQVLEIANPLPDKLGSLISGFVRTKRRINDDVRTYLLSLNTSFFYVGTLLVLSIGVALLHRYKITPNFESIFLEYGGSLPEFTQFMMGEGAYILFVLMILSLAFLFIMFMSIWEINRKVRLLKTIPENSPWAFFTRDLVGVINSYIALSYVSLFIRAGCDNEQAISYSNQMAESDLKKKPKGFKPHEEIRKTLDVCSRLNTLQDEIDYQMDTASEKLAAKLTQIRRGINVGFQIMVFIVIGALVTSYYLPIFKLGSIL